MLYIYSDYSRKRKKVQQNLQRAKVRSGQIESDEGNCCLLDLLLESEKTCLILSQGSPHIEKQGDLTSLSLLTLGRIEGKNLGDFLKLILILTFLSPLPHVPLSFTKMNVLYYDLKKDAFKEFGIKY